VTSPRTALRLSAIIFGLICLGHLWRVLRHVDVRIGSLDVPMWPSTVALVVGAALSIWLWTLSKR
jgi:hypothetical protein